MAGAEESDAGCASNGARSAWGAGTAAGAGSCDGDDSVVEEGDAVSDGATFIVSTVLPVSGEVSGGKLVSTAAGVEVPATCPESN